MLDIHCHILPGVDDGAASLDESLAMARCCENDGVTHIIATPHCNRHYRLFRADILPHVARLNDELAKVKIALRVLPGSEIQVTDTAAYRREFDAGLYCHLGDDSAFTLLEFGKLEQYPTDVAELVSWLRQRGTTPIIAHPERYDYFAADPGRLRALTAAGAWLQVTVASLLGHLGHVPQVFGEMLLREYRDSVLATDAHSLLHSSGSGLLAGYTWVRQRMGETWAEDLQARENILLAAMNK
jgi:protein-tyrosine phosphatase